MTTERKDCDAERNSIAHSTRDTLEVRRVNWVGDGDAIRSLFETTWRGHPITNKRYFDWQFLEKPKGKGIGYCAFSSENPKVCAGVYAIIPARVLVGDREIELGTSLYTMTRPDYYRQGVFGMLARKTYADYGTAGICGTIGVPNNNSLPGFTKGLGFQSIGQFQVLARIAGLPSRSKTSVQIEWIQDERRLMPYAFELDLLKAKSGTVLAERSPGFVAWRFLKCPGVKYHVVVATDSTEVVRGIIVVRATKKKGMPITVVLDFLVDEAFVGAGAVAATLLYEAYKFAWRHLSPLIITLVNPNSHEAKAFLDHGFKRLPNVILPHDSNFIIKLHPDLPDEVTRKLLTFENWYFSFADYDIF